MCLIFVLSVCAFSVTRMVAYFHVGGGFLAHYNDETCWLFFLFFFLFHPTMFSVLGMSFNTKQTIHPPYSFGQT